MNFLHNATIFSFYKVKTILSRTLKRKYFEIETNTKREVYNDINYSSNYNKIFENNNSELDEQTLPINKLDS